MNPYDLIVVGAGSAGAVVAARVGDAGARVLLLEAGPDYPSFDALPDDLRNGNDNSYLDHDWGLVYTPSRRSIVQPFPRGRVVGGSSAVNTCIALRGEPDDYDEWAKLAGDEWSWERCLEAFVRLETDEDFGDSPHHGADGPLPIRRYRAEDLQPIQAAYLEACDTLGIPRCDDHNAPGAWGAGFTPLNKRGSHRVSVATAYLDPRRGSPNLTIRAAALVRRVTFQAGRVTGVELADGERIDCPNVVVSAGAIMTPPLLVRSGVGPAETLARLGIEPVSVREGVGARLLDHPATAIALKGKPGTVDETSPIMQACMRFAGERSGDLFTEALSYAPWFGRGMGICAIAAAVYRTAGHGTLRVVSADPAAAPEIESGFFDDPADLDAICAAVRMAFEIAQTKPVRDLTEELIAPAPEVVADDEKLRDHVRLFCSSGYHPSGTAPMGLPDDPAAVCDQYGRVIGAQGLRVADASLMPTVPRANTNVPTIMIGERVGTWLATELA